MIVDEIWKLHSGSVVEIEGRVYEYINKDGARIVKDLVIGDEHYIDEWFVGDEEVKVCGLG